MEESWGGLRGRIDAERHQAVLLKLRRQAEDAAAWRDKCLGYFRAIRDSPTRLCGGSVGSFVRFSDCWKSGSGADSRRQAPGFTRKGDP